MNKSAKNLDVFRWREHYIQDLIVDTEDIKLLYVEKVSVWVWLIT